MMPAGGGPPGSPAAFPALGYLAMTAIMENSGNARVLIGGCSECRWAEIVGWSSGQPTSDTRGTGGDRSSSGYPSIIDGKSERVVERELMEVEVCGMADQWSSWAEIGEKDGGK